MHIKMPLNNDAESCHLQTMLRAMLAECRLAE
jgi:hypothetical protein